MRSLARPLSKLSGFSGMFALAVLLAILLGALAWLQYRWVGQLSADERDRIKDHLRDSADDFAEDFNRELTRLFFWLQYGPVVRQGEPPEPDEFRYERWFGTAEHPDLVATIYQVDVDERGGLTLRQFFRQQPRLEKAEWPAALEPIRAALVERHKPLTAAAAAPTPPPPGRLASLWPDVSAVVVPRVRLVTAGPAGPGVNGSASNGSASNGSASNGSASNGSASNGTASDRRRANAGASGERPNGGGPHRRASGGAGPTGRSNAPGPIPLSRQLATMQLLTPPGYTIALLNPKYLRQQLIPRLVERYFTKDPDGALHVAVKGAQGVVYATEGAAPAVFDRADVRESLWEIRFHEFPRFVTERRVTLEHGREPAAVGAPGAPVAPGERIGDRDVAFARPMPPRPGRPGGGASPPPPSITVMYRNEDRGRGGGRGAVAGTPWQVHVLHSAGSLDAAVGRARSRNLLVSFSVLLLLGASMTLVLISSARARRLAAQQMEFVAGVSHELRTPLAVIRSAGENLADGIIEDDKQVRRYGQLIAGEGRRLTQMVEQVMTFAGLQAGRPGFDLRPIDIGPVVEEALSAVAPVAREHEAEIVTDVAATLPRILGDPSAVGRALQNLLGNALKYGGAPPRITVAVRVASPRLRGRQWMDVSATEHGHSRIRGMVDRVTRQEVEVAVSDNGPGIAARDLLHIFEPFYRGADAVAKQIHGSGLGLSLVQRIMHELGGRVSVVSTPGQGSTFTLHLPVAPEAEAIAHASPAALPADR